MGGGPAGGFLDGVEREEFSVHLGYEVVIWVAVECTIDDGAVDGKIVGGD